MRVKGTGVRQTSNPDMEPDFYGEYSGSKEVAAAMVDQAPILPGLPTSATKSLPAQQHNLLTTTIHDTTQSSSNVGSNITGQGERSLLEAVLSSEPQQPYIQPSRLLTNLISPLETSTQALLENENTRLASLLLLKQAEEQTRNALLLRMHEESERQNKLLALMLQPPLLTVQTATASANSSELPLDIISQSRLLSDSIRSERIKDQLLRGQLSGDDLRLLGL